MAPHMTLLQVFDAITNNDLPTFRNAIFYYGVRIHKIKIWNDLTPLLYAGKLGHFAQIKILLKDLTKSGCRGYVYKLWDKLFPLILNHRKSDYKSVHEMITWITKSRNVLERTIERMIETIVRERAFEFTETVLDGRDEYIDAVVQYCFQYSRTELFDIIPSRIKEQRMSFRTVIQNLENTSPLAMAIIRTDTESLKSLIIDKSTNNDKDKVSLLKRVVQSRNSSVLRFLTEISMINHTLEFTGLSSKQELFLKILKLAADESSLEIMDEVLQHDQFDYGIVDWARKYYTFILLHGKTDCAERIRHLVNFTDDKKLRQEIILLKELTQKPADLPSGMNEANFLKILDVVDRLPEEIRETCPLVIDLKKFPLYAMRPDLYYALSERLSLQYPKAAILETPENLHALNFPTAEPAWSGLQDQTFNSVLATPLFFGHSKTVSLPYKRWILSSSQRKLISYFVVETGKPLVLKNTSLLLDPSVKRIFNEIESERLEKLNLKKLCRLKIREAIMSRIYKRISKFQEPKYHFGRVMDDVVSLYVDGYLPRKLVDYILYRTDNGESSLYHLQLYMLTNDM